MKVKAAREKILELLQESGALIKQEAISHAVKCAERSGAPLEILVTPQWFITTNDSAALQISAMGHSQEIETRGRTIFQAVELKPEEEE